MPKDAMKGGGEKEQSARLGVLIAASTECLVGPAERWKILQVTGVI